jgi:hypothetical protein
MTKESTIDQVCVREFRFRMLTKKTFPAKQENSICLSFDLRVLMITPLVSSNSSLYHNPCRKKTKSTTTDTRAVTTIEAD